LISLVSERIVAGHQCHNSNACLTMSLLARKLDPASSWPVFRARSKVKQF
jgi:hypothetical protein